MNIKTIIATLLLAVTAGCASTQPATGEKHQKRNPDSVCFKNPYCQTITPAEWERKQLLTTPQNNLPDANQ